jgi:hypothetical protein
MKKAPKWDLGMVGGQSSDVHKPLFDTGGEVNKPAPSIDVPKLEERAFRRGLIAALECILRELQ